MWGTQLKVAWRRTGRRSWVTVSRWIIPVWKGFMLGLHQISLHEGEWTSVRIIPEDAFVCGFSLNHTFYPYCSDACLASFSYIFNILSNHKVSIQLKNQRYKWACAVQNCYCLALVSINSSSTLKCLLSCPTATLNILVLVTSWRLYKEDSDGENILNQTAFLIFLVNFIKLHPCKTNSQSLEVENTVWGHSETVPFWESFGSTFSSHLFSIITFVHLQ